MKRKFILRKGIIFSLVCMFLVTSCYRIDDLSGVFDGDKMLPGELMLPIGVLDMNIVRILEQINLGEGIGFGINGDTVSLFYRISEDFDFRIPELDETKFSTLDNVVTYPGVFPEVFDIDINSNITVEHIEAVLMNEFDIRLRVTATGMVDWSGIQITTYLYENVRQMSADGRNDLGAVAPEVRSLSGSQDILISYRNILINPSNYNTLPMTVRVEATPGAIPAGSSIRYEYSIERADWKVAYGTFPAAIRARQANQSHDFDISAFDGFRFYDPRINISVRSNVGTTFQFWIDYIEAYHSDNEAGTTVRAQFNNASTGFMDSDSTFVNISKRPANWWDDSVTVSIGRFDRVDGKTYRLFDNVHTPNRFRYSYSVKSYLPNPDPIGTRHFITPDASVTVTAEAELPLWLRERRVGEERGYQLTDTIFDMNLESNLPESSVHIENLRLELRVTNGLPSDVFFEVVEFLDKDGNRIDIHDFQMRYHIAAPPTNSDGTAIHAAAERQILRITFSEEQFEQFRRADQMIFHLHVDLNDGDSQIRITPDDFFRVQVGVFVRGDIDSGVFTDNND